MATATPLCFENVAIEGAIPASEVVHRSLDTLRELHAYNRWLYDHIQPFVGRRVCEVGSGTGNITQFLLQAAEVLGLEPAVDAFIEVEQRFATQDNVRFVNCALGQALAHGIDPRAFDSVVCTNVLEHIENDREALRMMARLCDTGGVVAIVVPAHMSIYGQIDVGLGHFRRYSRASLRRLFEAVGLRVVHSRYMNMPGYFTWGLCSRVLRHREITEDGARYFNRLVPWIRAIERFISPPFGQSIVMAGTPAG